MSTLVIRKKSLKTWLHTDSILGDFIISKFYFNADNVSFQIVEQGQSKRVIYNITDITLYALPTGGTAETFTTITELSLRLEELNYPAFQYDGQITSIANLISEGSNITITGDGTLASPYVISATGGGFGTPPFSDVLEEGRNTGGTNPLINNDDAIELENGSKLQKGTVDNGYNGGISQICTADKEMQWENGVRYLRAVGGTNVYAETMDNITPDAFYDNTENWAVGSYYKNLVTNDLYKCTDASTGSAVWELQTGVEFSLGDFVYRKNGVDTAVLGADGPNRFGIYTIYNSIIAQEDITDPDNIVYTYGSKIGELEKIRIDNDTFKWLGNQVATLDDIPGTPSLNDVTAIGNTSNQNIIIQEAGVSNIEITNNSITRNALEYGGSLNLVFPNSAVPNEQYFKDATGTIALTSDIIAQVNSDWNATSGVAEILNKPTIPSSASFVPYTGATADVDLDTNGLDAKFVKIKGTAGNGKLTLKHQSSGITASASESALAADSSGNPIWKNDGNAQQNVMLQNSAITGATKTKITYDSKGLVTSGTDATTADIADSTNKRYVTDAQQTVIGNTSGTNTGDETATTIRTKLGITTLSGSNTGDNAVNSLYSGLASSKQNVPIKQGYTQLTGVTGTQVLASLLIPADWLASGDGFEIVVVANKSTTASGVNFLLYHDTTLNGTTNAIATATSLTISQRMGYIQRIMSLNSTTLYNCLPVASTSLIPIAATGATPTTTFNPTVTNYITLTVNPTVGSEVTGFNQFFIRKL
jgi:hypothetical protein